MRLIDADALLKKLNEERIPYNADVNFFIANAPTIDAVPKTQCRDCQFSGKYSGINLRMINATD